MHLLVVGVNITSRVKTRTLRRIKHSFRHEHVEKIGFRHFLEFSLHILCEERSRQMETSWAAAEGRHLQSSRRPEHIHGEELSSFVYNHQHQHLLLRTIALKSCPSKLTSLLASSTCGARPSGKMSSHTITFFPLEMCRKISGLRWF